MHFRSFINFFIKFRYRYINVIFFCSHWLAMSNSCYNPIIYGIFSVSRFFTLSLKITINYMITLLYIKIQRQNIIYRKNLGRNSQVEFHVYVFLITHHYRMLQRLLRKQQWFLDLHKITPAKALVFRNWKWKLIQVSEFILHNNCFLHGT